MAINITANLKSWLVENGLPEDADNAACVSFVAEKLLDGTLKNEKFVELTTDESAKGYDAITAGMTKLMEANERLQKQLDEMAKKETAAPAAKVSPLNAMLSKAGGAGDGTPTVNVKGAWEQYDGTKSVATYPLVTKKGSAHPRAGQTIVDGVGDAARTLQTPSELDKACNGVFFKWRAALGGHSGQMPQALRFNGDPKALKGETHDEQVMLYMLHEKQWCGVVGGEYSDSSDYSRGVVNRKLTDMEIKQVIDDTTSGGQYITPITYDENVVLPVLLYGEFAPYVTMTPITRGRRVESAVIGQLSTNSGGGDGTDITLTTTTGFITAFNTVIYTGDLGIDLGLDMLSDSVVNLGEILTAQAGEQMMEWLDEQICVGDGTSEPEGITVASGTSSVTHSSAAPTLGKYVEHFLSVGKQYLQGTDPSQIRFGGTQTSYLRARSIAVGSSDARLVFGGEGNSGLADYTLFGRYPYGINAALGNTKVFFGNLKHYQMYRRLGMEIRTTTEGRTNLRANKMTMVARWRFGGQVRHAAAFTYASDAQA